MKRSEMVEKIAKSMSRIDSQTVKALWNKADDLLRELEKAGMLPPSAPLKMGGKVYHDNYWEPEDENKSGAI